MEQNTFLLVFIPAKKYIKYFSGTTQINLWKSNGMPKENITKSDCKFAPTFGNHYLLPDINFNGHCLINNICISRKVMVSPWFRNLNTDFTLNNCLVGSVELTKNADLDKYKYSSYGIGFDSHSEFSFTDGSMGKNVIIFGANMSSSVNIDNENKDILILGEEQYKG